MEANTNLSFEIQKLETTKKRLSEDITLLDNTTNSIDQLGKEMEELASGWKILTSYCLNIQKDVATVRSTLLSNKTTQSSPTRASQKNKTKGDPNRQSKKAREDIIQQLKKTREDMNLVNKAAKFFVEAYDTNMLSLVIQLDQLMAISHTDQITLKNKLVQDSNNSSIKVEEMWRKEFQSSV